MKAGVACLLFTMRMLKESGAKLGGCLRLHIVSDEEAGRAGGPGGCAKMGMLMVRRLA